MSQTRNRLVIAHFSVWKTALVASPLLLATYAVLRFVLFSESGRAYYFVSRPQWIPFIVLVLVATFAFLLYLTILVYLIVFRSRAAIWVEPDTERLIFVHRLVRSVQLRDASCVSVGTMKAYGLTFRALAFEMKDGSGPYAIATALLAEKPEDIVSRLHKCLYVKTRI